MTTIYKIKESLKEFEVKKQTLIEELRKEFPSIFKELFEKSELINSISWKQYTMNFNDGDPCHFSVYADYPDVNGENINNLEWYDWRYKYYIDGNQSYANLMTENPKINGKECKILYDFLDILNFIPEDFMEDLFGGDAQVTINRDGTIDVENYCDHD